VGYLKDGFDETRDAGLRRNEEKALEQIQALGVKLSVVKAPEWSLDVSSSGVEAAAFFDELVRSGRDKQMTNPGRASAWRNARAVPAVEYLQNQRARTMMMMKLAEATADVDVYLAPANSGGPVGAPASRGPGGATNRSVVQRHFIMANLACYPALAVPNGFTEAGTPGTMTFYARPFAEGELLALAKAYQDASGFHLRRPSL